MTMAVGCGPRSDEPETFREYAEFSAYNGIPDMHRQWRCLGWRLWYVVWTIAATVLMIWNAVVVTKDFFNYPTETQIQLMHGSSKADFPAVSICNLNPIKEDTAGTVVTDVFTNKTSVKKQLAVDWDDWEENYEPEESEQAAMDDAINVVIYENDIDVKVNGHQLKDMLLECEYLKRTCSPRNFTQWIGKYPLQTSAMYGNCYTFVVNTTQSYAFIGPQYGLNMVLYTQTGHYLDTTDAAGFRVQIHPANHIPFPDDEGFTVSPGFASTIGVRMVHIERTPLPYDGTDCGDYNTEYSLYNIFKQWDQLVTDGYIPWVNYTQKSCQNSCESVVTYELCGCIDSNRVDRGSVETYFPDGQIPRACYRTDVEDKLCLEKSARLLNTGVCYPLCPSACSETFYEKEITASQWPRADNIEDKLEAWSARVKELSDITTLTEAREAVAKVEVYLQELNYQLIKESAKYNFWSFMSDLGGAFGLWTGLSVLGMVQLIEFFVMLLGSCAGRSGNKDNQSPKRRPSSIESSSGRDQDLEKHDNHHHRQPSPSPPPPRHEDRHSDRLNSPPPPTAPNPRNRSPPASPSFSTGSSSNASGAGGFKPEYHPQDNRRLPENERWGHVRDTRRDLPPPDSPPATGPAARGRGRGRGRRY